MLAIINTLISSNW